MQNSDFSIALSFRRSRSSRYAFAVKQARTFPSYREGEDEEDGTVHSILLTDELRDHDVFTRLISLLDMVGGWKHTVLTVGGRIVEASAAKQLAAVSECYHRQRRSGNPYHYCNGFDPRHSPTHFGCRLLTSVDRRVSLNGQHHQETRRWYNFGELDGDGFRVDKKRILEMLMDDAERACAHACPVFSAEAVTEEVASVPEKIDVRTHPKFVIGNRRDGSLGIRVKSIVDRSEGPDREEAAQRRADVRPARQAATEDSAPTEDVRTIPEVTFADVCGQDEAVSAVRDWVELPLRHPELFNHVGVPTHVGILLYGPPGTGKTLLAQAVAGESRAHLEIINGPEILSKWVGQSEQTMRGIFDRAKRLAPSVILLDEVDAIAPARDRVLHGHEVTLVSQLLTLMDGLYDRGQVIVVATTNRLAAVDPALRRPGRFDYTIRLGMPDAGGREAIFRRHLALMSVSQSLELAGLVEHSQGMCGAEIAKVCRQAGLFCVKEAIGNGYSSVEAVMIEPQHLTRALEEMDRRGGGDASPA